MNKLSSVDKLLMGYAAGRLTQAEALMVAAHLHLNAEARKRVSEYEAIGGRMMCEQKPAELHKECLAAVLNRIEVTTVMSQPDATVRATTIIRHAVTAAAPVTAVDPAAKARAEAALVADGARKMSIPEKIFALLSGNCCEKNFGWTVLADGIEAMSLKADTPNPCKRQMRLVRAQPQKSMPAHHHAGREITLVLSGDFSDQSGQYKAGDMLVIHDPRYVHSPKAGEQGCVCLNLTDAPGIRTVFIQFFSVFRRA